MYAQTLFYIKEIGQMRSVCSRIKEKHKHFEEILRDVLEIYSNLINSWIMEHVKV